MVVDGELVGLEETIQLAILSAGERDDRASLENALRVLDLLARRQRPEEPGEPVHVTGALQYLADARDLRVDNRTIQPSLNDCLCPGGVLIQSININFFSWRHMSGKVNRRRRWIA